MNGVQSPNLGTGGSPTGTDNIGKEFYFDYPAENPTTRFILVDPKMNFLYGGLYTFSVGNERYNWLSDRIDEARVLGRKWIVVANHENYISSGIKSDEIGSDYFNLVMKKRPDLLLQGHDHNYQRGKQLYLNSSCSSISASTSTAGNSACIVSGSQGGDGPNYSKGLGTVLVINGSGGVGHYTLSSSSDVHYNYFAARNDTAFGFSKFTVTPSGITSSYVDKATTSPFTDTFSISVSGSTVTPPPPPAADTTAPTTPTNLTASVVSSTQISLTWSASTDNVGVTGYEVYRNGVKAGTVTSTSYNSTGLSASTTYNYYVRAFDAASNFSSASITVNATTQSAPDTSAPTAPTNLTAAVISQSQINLTWTASSDNVGVTGYDVYRNNTKVGTVTSASYTNTGLTAGTTYSFFVKAFDGAANVSGASNTVNATTMAPPDTTAPTAPANLVATVISSTQINLSWSASTDNVGVTAYEVYRDNVKVATMTTTGYGDATRSPATTYYYYVKARDTAGNLSVASATVAATTFPQVSVIGSIHGTIFSSLTTPIYLGKVSIVKDGVNKTKKTYYTDSKGAFSIANLAAGTYKVTYSAKQHVSQSESLTITDTTSDITKNIILQRR